MRKLIFGCLMFMCLMVNCSALDKSQTKYFKTVVSADEKYYTNYEITEEEYNSVQDSDISLLSSVPYVETSYKKLSIAATGDFVNLQLEWKVNPSYRSYDVIALRGEDVTFVTGSISGFQNYLKDGESGLVSYDDATSNTNIFSNGYGISMNMVDGATNYLMSTDVIFQIAGSDPYIYGAYQHAQRNVTLSQSQNYTINASGYGRVVLFNSSVSSYYDQMNGVYLDL